MISLSVMDTVRTCGTCSECCKIKEFPSLPKAEWHKCGLLGSSHGCMIYEDRPDECREYSCLWLSNPMIPEEMRPGQSKIIFDIVEINSVPVFVATECTERASRDTQTERFLYLLSQSCVVMLREYKNASSGYNLAGPEKLLALVHDA